MVVAMKTVRAKAAKARLLREAAVDDLQAEVNKRYLQNLNKNLRSTRKRQRGWTSPESPETDYNTTDRKKAIAKSRQKVEESPIVLGMVQTMVDNIVGPGYRLSMQTADKDWNKNVETLWLRVRDKLDIRGVRRWGRLQRMWVYRKIIDGDVGIRLFRGGKNKDGTHNSYLQTCEADQITKDSTDPKDTGIKFNKVGKPVRYFIGPRNSMDDKKRVSVPASNFILFANFPHERVNRKRGVSQLLQNLSLFEDLEEIIDAMTQKVKNESFLGLKFKTDLPPDGSNFGAEIEEVRTAEDGKKRKMVRMVPGMNLNLAPNEDADVLESKAPHSEFTSFIRFVIRYMGTAVGLPLEMLLMDFSDTNYSGGRSTMEVAKKRFKVEQAEISFASTQIFQWWLAREIEHNGLKVPKKVKGVEWAHRWGTPGWPYLDPKKEVEAQGLALDRGFMTLDQILAETSDMDVEDVVAQRQYELDLFREAKIPIITGLPGSNIINEESLAE